jgi:CheY-like chemotaxis protein/anti-sigma regulatory factor (Ser/Thr protein kinase)
MEEQTTVLIVDDDPGGREALEGVLFSQGYNLVFAESGEEAYQKALDLIPDIILLDVMMPAMDGFAVCRMLRTDTLLAEVPILLVTALDDRAFRIKGIEAGADDFISKPFDRLELRARVNTITRLNRFRRLILERARLVWVIDQADEGYVILNEDKCITYSNDSGRKMFHFPPDGFPAETFWRWVDRHYEFEPEESWQKYFENNDCNGPLYFIKPENETSPGVFLQLDMLDLPFGERQSMLIRVTDVTQKINFENNFWSFQSMIAHKLRTPLANTRMAVDFLIYRTNKHDDELKEIVEIVSNSTRRLETDVQEIISFANKKNLAQKGSFSISGLKKMCEDICADFGINANSCVVESFNPYIQNLEIVLSQQALDLMIKELVENSIKFHPNHTPQIEIKIGLNNNNKQLRLRVLDNGVHLTPEQLKWVWKPYYQAENHFSGEIRGMGLGLSAIANQIWNVGGKCSLQNREDQPGVIVTLDMPTVEKV